MKSNIRIIDRSIYYNVKLLVSIIIPFEKACSFIIFSFFVLAVNDLI